MPQPPVSSIHLSKTLARVNGLLQFQSPHGSFTMLSIAIPTNRTLRECCTTYGFCAWFRIADNPCVFLQAFTEKVRAYFFGDFSTLRQAI